MEKDNNPAEEMAKEVVDELWFINKNKGLSKYLRSARQFHEQKDQFIEKIMDNIASHTNKSMDTKCYDNMEKNVRLFLSRCQPNHRAGLVQKWNKVKNADHEEFLNAFMASAEDEDNNVELKKIIRKMYLIGKQITRYAIDDLDLEKWGKPNGKYNNRFTTKIVPISYYSDDGK